MHKSAILLIAILPIVGLPSFAQDTADPNRVQSRSLLQPEVDGQIATPGTTWPWECNPSLYGFTDVPAGNFRFPSEYEQTQGIFLGWPSYACGVPELIEIIRAAVSRTTVWVMVNNLYRPSMITCLRSHGFSDEELSMINTLNVPVDTIWDRDYGMEVINEEDGSLSFIDMSYYPAPAVCPAVRNRPNDDASPTRLSGLAGRWGGVNVYRPQLRAEGGNLQTDGNGTCFRLQRDTEAQNQFSQWYYTPDQLNAVYGQYLNCSQMVVLESLLPYRGQRNIDHIDMFMSVISPNGIIVGRYDPDDDPVNAAILDRNAATLQSLGYTVYRIPQPQHYCTIHRPTTCQANPGDARVCGGTGLDVVWATYANSIRVGNSVLVPVYHDVPAELSDIIQAQESEALATFQQALDTEFGTGVVDVVPVVSDSLIPCLGSLHCITMTHN